MNPSPEISQLVKNLVKEIKSKDINQNNLKRAGTDIEQNMDFNYRQNLEQKFIQLRQEFNTMNPNPNTFVTLNELYNFFVTKNPAVKKEEMQTLFDMNNRDKGLKISLNDFIYIYLLINKNNKKIIMFISIILLTILITIILIFKFYPKIIINIFNGSLYYRCKRIIEYKNNYQINNALIGIGSSKLLPIRLNKLLIYIPERITDFIFSFNICNYGIISCLLLLGIISIFIYKLLSRYHNKLFYYKRKLLGTFLTIYIIQTLYNIFMNIGLVPIMGIPLPFISYWVSNIITYFILYSFTVKTISYKDSNNYKNNYHKDLEDKKYNHMIE